MKRIAKERPAPLAHRMGVVMASSFPGLAAAVRAIARGEPLTPEMSAAIAAALGALTRIARDRFPKMDEEIQDVVGFATEMLVRKASTIRATSDAGTFAWLRTVTFRRATDVIRQRRRRWGRDRPAARASGHRTSRDENDLPSDYLSPRLAQDERIAVETILARILTHAPAQQRPSIEVAIRARQAGSVRDLLPDDATATELNRIEQQASRGRQRARAVAAALDPPLEPEEMRLVEAFFPVRDG